MDVQLINHEVSPSLVESVKEGIEKLLTSQLKRKRSLGTKQVHGGQKLAHHAPNTS